MNVIHLIPYLDGEPRRGAWWHNGKHVVWGCPKCGQAHQLVTHQITEDGDVVPSVVCGKCGFHDYISLEESGEYITQ